MKKWWPGLAAVIILAIVTVLDMLPVEFLHQQGNFETLSNVALIIVAVIGFFQRKPDGSSDYGSIFSNTLVSIIAFPMNIIIFKHAIRPEYFLEDLWCWHLFWLICAIVQIFGLSTAGKKLLAQVLAFLGWVRDRGSQVGNMFSDTLSSIQNSDKKVLVTIFIGIVGLLGDVGFHIYTRGLEAAFTNPHFLVEKFFLWVILCVFMLFLIHTIPLVLQKVKDAIQNMAGKWILAVLAVVIFAVLAGVMPFLLQALAFVLLIPALAMGVLWSVIKGSSRIWENIYKGQEKNKGAGDSTARDWAAIMLAYIGIPLTIIPIL